MRHATNPDEAAFLDAVLASPNDDTARLVYADWLDERDDPLGEFVRLHVARSASIEDGHFVLPTSPTGGDAERLRLLAEVHSSAWIEQPPPHLESGKQGFSCVSLWVPQACFYKGLPIYDVYVSGTNCAACLAATAEWLPARAQVYLGVCLDPETALTDVLAHPFAGRVTWLSIYGPPDYSRPQRRDRSDCERVRVTRQQVEAIASWDRVTSLVAVNVIQPDEPATAIIRETLGRRVRVTIDHGPVEVGLS